MRGNWSLMNLNSFPGHKSECVKRRAVLSLQATGHCGEDAEKFVETVFDTCMSDLDPFIGTQ